MPFEIDIDPIRQIARIRVSGRIERAEFESSARRFLEHPDFVPGMPAIYDLRDIDFGSHTAEESKIIGEMNQGFAKRRGSAKIALVVSDDFRFGMARMHQVVSESPNLNVSVFRNLDEAEEWALASPPSDIGDDIT